MSSENVGREMHPGDDGLVRLLDGELSPEERARVQSHLEECESCSGRLEQLRLWTTNLGRRLDGSDFARPAWGERAESSVLGGTRTGWSMLRYNRLVQAAAAVLLLTAALVSVRPVRAWIVERSAQIWQLMGGSESTEPESVPSEQRPPDGSGGVVSFRPTGSELMVQVETLQDAGTVTVRVDSVELVSAEIVGETTSEGFLVLPGVLRVLNHSESQASYLVTVPARLERVRVQLAGRDATDVLPGQTRDRVTIPLTGDRR